MTTAVLEAMGEDDLLARATECAEAIRDAEAELLRVAYQWAVTHDPHRLDPRAVGRPGREKARMFGGDGTPEVAEFAAAELGARIGRSTHAGSTLMADALDLHHRHPLLWERVEAGEVRASYARFVAARTRDLSREEAGYVDAAVAESADGRIPWSRFEVLVEASVAKAAPELAREKEERAARARFAKKVRGEANGMATFMIRADTATIDQIDAAVTAGAAGLEEAMPEATLDDRRVHAVLLLVSGRPDDTPMHDLMPQVTLFVHTFDEIDHPSGLRINRLEGHGPVTDAWVRQQLGPTCRFKIQPVLDLAGQAPVDAYEIPDRHRQAVHLMTPADCFPFSSSTSRHMQVDHTTPYERGGVSGVGNYGPMTTTHHRIKTHGRWAVKQPFPGIYLWRDPHGQLYLVDHTGTRMVGEPPGNGPVGRTTVVEFWHETTARIDWAA
jgi:hypothetical protein